MDGDHGSVAIDRRPPNRSHKSKDSQGPLRLSEID
jgi:hypothetical protein